MIVAVIGGSDASSEALDKAEAAGREIARHGATLVCGGLGGVMEAACRGCRDAGGTTIGILPGTDASEANPYVDVPVVTGMGQARNLVIVRTADAVIAIGGGFGTLSEMAFALRLGKPLVGIDTWSMQIDGRPVAIERFDDATAAVERAIALASGKQGVTQHA
jgi:hypothetical protein